MALRLGIDLKLFDAIDAQVGSASTETFTRPFDVSAICEALSHADPLLIRKLRFTLRATCNATQVKAIYVCTKYLIFRA